MSHAKQSKRHFQRQVRAIKENAHLNRDFTPYLIPRTQRANAVVCSLPQSQLGKTLRAYLGRFGSKQSLSFNPVYFKFLSSFTAHLVYYTEKTLVKTFS